MNKSQYILLACLGAFAPLHASQTVYLGNQSQPEDGLTLDANAAYVNEDGTPADVTDWTQADVIIDAEKSGPVNTIKAPQELFKVNSLTIAGNWNTQENPQLYWRPIELTETSPRGRIETVGNFNIYSAIAWDYAIAENKNSHLNLDLTVGGDLNISVPKNDATYVNEKGETVSASSDVMLRYGGNYHIKGDLNFTDSYANLCIAELQSLKIDGDLNASNLGGQVGEENFSKIDLWLTRNVEIGGNLLISHTRTFEATGYAEETSEGSGEYNRMSDITVGGYISFGEGWTDMNMNSLRKFEVGKNLAPGSDAVKVANGGFYAHDADLVEIHGNMSANNIWTGFGGSKVVKIHGDLSLTDAWVNNANIKESLTVDGNLVYDAKNHTGRIFNMSTVGMTENSDFKGGITVGGDFQILNMPDREGDVNNLVLFSSGYLHVGGDFKVDNVQGIYADYLGRYRVAGAYKVNGGIDVKGAMTISNVRTDANFENSGFLKAASLRLENIDTAKFSVIDSIKIDGDFSVTDVKYFTINDIGRLRDENDQWLGYTDAAKNGIEVGGSMTFTGVGDAGRENSLSGWNSSFIKVGKDLSFVNINAHANFSGIGSQGDYGGGGVDVGGNLLLDNRSSGFYDLDMNNSKYISVKGNADVYNGSLRIYDTKTVEIGKDLNVHSGNAFADRTEYFSVMGRLSTEGIFENRDAGYTHIGGDLNIGASGYARFGNFHGKDGGAQSAENAGLEIGGRINISEGGKIGTWFSTNAGTAPTDAKELFVSASGINGKGYILLEDGLNKSTDTAYSVTYVLNGASNSGFEGGIHLYKAYQRVNDTAFDNMRLNIIKNGNGIQKFIMNDSDSNWHGTVTVNQGLFELYTAGSNKVDIILNENSRLAVSYAYDGAHNPDANMGEINANDIYINGKSSIAFDVSRYDNGDGTFMYVNDMIYANEVSGDGALDLIIDLSLIDEGTAVSLTGLDSLNIFRVATDNAYDWDGKAKVIVMYKGADISESFTIKNIWSDSNSVYAELTGVVPEPAEVAAILGIASLFLAAARRRK